MPKKPTAEAFLKNMSVESRTLSPEPQGAPLSPPEVPRVKRSKSRTGLKHIGGYFERSTVEKVAILRARLDLDNSELIKKAIEELYLREMAAQQFGDR